MSGTPNRPKCSWASGKVTGMPQHRLGWLQVKNGTLFVNDIPREEPFINEPPYYNLRKLVVPPGDVRYLSCIRTCACGVAQSTLAACGWHCSRPASELVLESYKKGVHWLPSTCTLSTCVLSNRAQNPVRNTALFVAGVCDGGQPQQQLRFPFVGSLASREHHWPGLLCLLAPPENWADDRLHQACNAEPHSSQSDVSRCKGTDKVRQFKVPHSSISHTSMFCRLRAHAAAASLLCSMHSSCNTIVAGLAGIWHMACLPAQVSRCPGQQGTAAKPGSTWPLRWRRHCLQIEPGAACWGGPC